MNVYESSRWPRGSGQFDYLRGVNQARAKADLQGQVSSLNGAVAIQLLRRKRDGGCRRVARVLDVPANSHGGRQPNLLDHLINDALVCLVGNEGLDVVGSEASRRDGLERNGSQLEGRPLEDALALLAQRRERQVAVLTNLEP